MEKVIPLLDTNVLIRFFTLDNAKTYKQLYNFFNSLEHGENHLELKLIVLFQTIFVLKSVYHVPKEQIADGILDLLKYKGIVIKEKKIILRMLRLWHEKNLDIVDCYLIACMEKNPKNILYSYDRDFDKFNINRKEP